MATKLDFLQYTYRFRINHKTLYSQTFPGPYFGSWTTATLRLKTSRVNEMGDGGCYLLSVISEHMLWVKFVSTSCEIPFKWIPHNTFDVNSRLVQVMAWCRQQQAITWAVVDQDLRCQYAANITKIYLFEIACSFQFTCEYWCLLQSWKVVKNPSQY